MGFVRAAIGGLIAPEKRPGVTVNRRDLVAIPVPNANLLWRDLHTRHVHTVDGRQRTDESAEDYRRDVLAKGHPALTDAGAFPDACES